MRLIVTFHSGSCYEGTDITFPAEYESAEALYCDIETACKQAKASGKHTFSVGDREFQVSDFYDPIGDDVSDGDPDAYIEPEIYTVDEWFVQCLELQGEYE